MQKFCIINTCLKQTLILKQHLNHCVTQACLNGGSEEKIDEIMAILEKAMSK